MKTKYIEWLRRKTATVLLAATLAESALLPVSAAEPAVSTDETMYVNLDSYGAVKSINVVKGVTPNGISQFTDYGTYQKVVNMSNADQPQLADGKVSWNLTDPVGRFYYQCTLEPSSIQLPWTIDVGYKLNGREIKAEDLAGASGLVEIHVTAEPNDNALEYYKNNMMLSVMIPADMSKCYSVDAPGSQTQSLGETTGVVFTALPGEEGDFTARIGTDSYESIGVVVMMIPGTTDSLQHVKDIKEAKDTWRSAGTALYDSTDAMLATIESMKAGVSAVQSGLNSLESARGKVSGNRAGIEGQTDVTIQALTDLAAQSQSMVPYLQTAKDGAEKLHTNMNELMTTVNEFKDPLDELQDHLTELHYALQDSEWDVKPLTSSLMQVIAIDAQLQAQEDTILMTLLGLSGTDLSDSISGDVSGNGGKFADKWAADTANKAIPDTGLKEGDDGYDEYKAAWNNVYDTAYQNYYIGYEDEALSQLQTQIGSIESPEHNLYAKKEALEALASSSNALSRHAQDTLNAAAKSTDDLAEVVVYADEMIQRVQDLKSTMNQYYPDFQNFLSDSQTMANNANNALNQTIASLTIIQNTMKSMSGDLDEGTRKTLDGSINLLDKTLNTLDRTGDIRRSSGVMKTTLDEQLDKFEDENKFLNMDPDAPMISFTSSENPEPHSLQIILRTDEISADDEADKTMDAEPVQTTANPFARMWTVLVKIFQAIADIFKER